MAMMTYWGREGRRGLLSYEIAVLFFSRSRSNLSLKYENSNTARIGIPFHLSLDSLPSALSIPPVLNVPPPALGRREE